MSKNKKEWIIYFIRMTVFIIALFIVKYIKTIQKEPEEISVKNIQKGEFDVFNDDQIMCGKIKITTSDDDSIIISLIGDAIEGYDVLNKRYYLEAIKYKDIFMKPETTNYETYYMYNTGTSYVLLFKIHQRNFYFVKKKVDLFMLCEVSHERYDYMINNTDSMELQKRCDSSIDTNRYTCFFEQENPIKEKKNNRFLMKHK